MTLFKETKLTMALLFAILLSGCEKAPNSSAPQGKAWQTQVVAKKEMNTTNLFSASIQGQQDIEVRAQVSGAIETVKINEGDRVRKGEILFVIDQVPYRAALHEAQANTKAAEATLATAKLNYESRQKLFNEKVIAEYELLTAENSLRHAEATLAQCKAAELSARNNLSYTEVKSPVDGVAGLIPYRQGALVGPTSEQPLTHVSDNSRMFVYFSIDENQALNLMRRWGSMQQMLDNMDEVELLLGDGSLYPCKGKVESMSGVVNRNTGTVALRAVFDNAERILLSGSSGNIQITTEHSDALVIPQAATLKIQDKYLVYKVVDGKAQSAQITISPANNGKEYIVLTGITEGDTIVADGVGLVREGMEIHNHTESR